MSIAKTLGEGGKITEGEIFPTHNAPSEQKTIHTMSEEPQEPE